MDGWMDLFLYMHMFICFCVTWKFKLWWWACFSQEHKSLARVLATAQMWWSGGCTCKKCLKIDHFNIFFRSFCGCQWIVWKQNLPKTSETNSLTTMSRGFLDIFPYFPMVWLTFSPQPIVGFFDSPLYPWRMSQVAWHWCGLLWSVFWGMNSRSRPVK